MQSFSSFSSFSSLAILTIATLAASQSHAAVQVIEPESTNVQCIDAVPFDDDFGWNGNCTCRLSNNNEYIDFGEQMYTSENTLFVKTGESPLACADTGSVTVYEIQNNGSLQKQAEILPRNLPGVFEFGATAKDLVSLYEYGSSSVTVHGRNNGSWRELYSIADPEGTTSRRFNHVFIDNELLLPSTNGIDRYEATTGNYLGNIPSIDPQIAGCDYYPTISKMGDFMVVTQSNINNRTLQCGVSLFTLDSFRFLNHVSLYEKASSGDWSLMFTHFDQGGLSSVKEDEIVFSYHERSVPQPQTYDRTAYTRDINGSWIQQPTVTVSLGNIEWNTLNAEYFSVDAGARFYPSIPTGENIGIVRPWRDSDPTPDTVDLNFYQLINGSSLNLAQEISFPFPSRRTTTLNSDNHMLVMYHDFARDTLTTQTLNRGSNGQWEELFDESIALDPASQFSAGNSTAMIDDHGFRAISNRLYHVYPTGSNSAQPTTPVGGSQSPVGTTTSCDYSNADLYDGWGWNATTSESCAPLTSVDPAITTITTAQCIDSDGDGFGWNGTETCIPDTTPATSPAPDSNCDYRNADLYGGWGWNATASQSCAPLENVVVTQPAVQCIDTDGDGWGWNGTASCRP